MSISTEMQITPAERSEPGDCARLPPSRSRASKMHESVANFQPREVDSPACGQPQDLPLQGIIKLPNLKSLIMTSKSGSDNLLRSGYGTPRPIEVSLGSHGVLSQPLRGRRLATLSRIFEARERGHWRSAYPRLASLGWGYVHL